MNIALLAIISLLGCAAPPARPPGGVPVGDTTYMKQTLDYEIPKLMEDADITSVVISVVDANGPIYEGAFGKADVGAGRAATMETPYRWSSNSKLLVMVALLQLVEQGKLKLDAPLVRYIPEFQIGAPPTHIPESSSWRLEDITIRRMLTHHSGLPNDVWSNYAGSHPKSFRTRVKALKTMHTPSPVDLAHSYSNVAFSLLGVVIERVSGEPFEAYVERHVLHPAGMDKSTFDWEGLLPTLARPHDKDGQLMPIYRLTDIPAGALIATPRDMGRFASALLRGGVGKRARFIQESTLQASYQQQNAHVPLDLDWKMGLAWHLDRLPVEEFGPSISHGGSGPGYHSAFGILTKDGVAAVVATNSDNGARKTNRIMKMALKLAREARSGMRPTERTVATVERAEHADPCALKRSVGHYATGAGSVHLEQEQDQLAVPFAGQRLLLKPLEDGTWGVWAELWGLIDLQPGNLSKIRVSLTRIGGRRVVTAHTPQGRRFLGVAYEPTAATAPWKKRVGWYAVIAQPGDYELVEGLRLHVTDNGQLMAEVHLPSVALSPSVALRVIDARNAVSEGLGRNQGLRLSVNDAGELELSGMRLRRAERPDD